nr:ABC transporter substrate-binding protein [uncultured Desulfuromonas sp.]
MAYPCCSMRNLLILLICLLCFGLSASALAKEGDDLDFPLDMADLRAELSDAHRPESMENRFPRRIDYQLRIWDRMSDVLNTRSSSLMLEQQPRRVIPHTVGLTEELWAIVPHERIVGLHESCRNANYSFLAEQFPAELVTFLTEDAEMVIGLQPDLVLTSFYSSAAFLHQLDLAEIPHVQTGFFGSIEDIRAQISLFGNMLGVEASARHLLQTMDHNSDAICKVVAQRLDGRTPTILYYDRMGFVAGAHTLFDALCKRLGVVNAASAHDIAFFKQIGYETVLKWNPDIIVVPADSGLKERLTGQPILAMSNAVLNRRVYAIPEYYLTASSQFVIASLNYLGGILNDK